MLIDFYAVMDPTLKEDFVAPKTGSLLDLTYKNNGVAWQGLFSSIDEIKLFFKNYLDPDFYKWLSEYHHNGKFRIQRLWIPLESLKGMINSGHESLIDFTVEKADPSFWIEI